MLKHCQVPGGASPARSDGDDSECTLELSGYKLVDLNVTTKECGNRRGSAEVSGDMDTSSSNVAGVDMMAACVVFMRKFKAEHPGLSARTLNRMASEAWMGSEERLDLLAEEARCKRPRFG